MEKRELVDVQDALLGKMPFSTQKWASYGSDF